MGNGSLPPHGVAWGGAWGPPWASESWDSDLHRQFLLDLRHRPQKMLAGKTLSCDGGLDRRALEVTYPASTGAAKSRTQATARERTQAGVLGSAYPSQVRAARGRSPASREGADQQPSLGGVSGSAGAGGKRAPGVLFQAQPLHGRSSLGSGAPVAAATAAWNATAASKTHASQHAASGSEPPVRSGGSRAPGR